MTRKAGRQPFLVVVVALVVLGVALLAEVSRLQHRVQTLEAEAKRRGLESLSLTAPTEWVAVQAPTAPEGPSLSRKINGQNPCTTNTQLELAIVLPIICFGPLPFALVWFGGAGAPVDFTGSETLSAVVYLRSPGFQMPTTIAQLSQLAMFVAGDALTGTIASEIGLNTELVLFHNTYNMITGSVPSQLGKLAKITTIELFHDRHLGGTLPTEFGNLRLLERLDLQDTAITGPLWSQLGLLSALTYVDLRGTTFTGTLPTEMGLLTSIFLLDLEDHGLSGAIPSEIARLTALQSWFSPSGHFVSVPSQVGLMSLLTNVALDGNAIAFLPSQLFQLQACTSLSLRDNNLQGSLAGNWVASDSLQSLDLSGNSLSGPIPSQLALFRTLTFLDFANNQFLGTLPTQVGVLDQLEFLGLDGNHGLHGSLPAQLARLTSLTSLWLGGNSFTGDLPEWLGALPALVELDVSNNNFEQEDSEVLVALLGRGVRVTCMDSGITNAECVGQLDATPPRLPWDAYYGIVAVGAVVAVLVVGSMWFTFRFRTHKAVKVTNPSISLVMLVGLLLFVATVVPLGLTMVDVGKGTRDFACKVTPQTIAYGSVLVLSSITLRNYPIYRIFANPQLQAVKVTPRQLLGVMGVALAVTVMLVVPFALKVTAKADNTHGCTTNGNIALGVFNVMFIGAWALAAGAMCWSIRNVPSEFQETSQVAKATYNLLTFGVALLTVPLTTSDPTPQFLSISLCVVLCVLNFVVLLYVPRVRRVFARRQEPAPTNHGTPGAHVRNNNDGGDKESSSQARAVLCL